MNVNPPLPPLPNILAYTYHDLQDLSWGWSKWTLILLWNGYFSLLDLPQEVACAHRFADCLFFILITT